MLRIALPFGCVWAGQVRSCHTKPVPVVSSSSLFSAGRGASHLLAPFQRRAYTCEPAIGVAGVLSYFACGWPFAKTRHEKNQKWWRTTRGQESNEREAKKPYVRLSFTLPAAGFAIPCSRPSAAAMHAFTVELSLLNRDFSL